MNKIVEGNKLFRPQRRTAILRKNISLMMMLHHRLAFMN